MQIEKLKHGSRPHLTTLKKLSRVKVLSTIT